MLRRQEPVLRRGAFVELQAQAHCYLFARHDQDQALMVMVNSGAEACSGSLSLPSSLPDVERPRLLFGQADVKTADPRSLTYALAARSGAIVALR
jgi:hypothetical protein